MAAAGNAKHAGSFLRLITTGGGAQERRFVGGSQVISEKVADRLGQRVVLEAPVRVVAQNGDGVRVVADGTTVQARHVILAVPPALASRLAYSPALPKGKAALLKALVPGHAGQGRPRSSIARSGATRASAARAWPTSGRRARSSTTRRPTARSASSSGSSADRPYAPWGGLPADQRRAQVLDGFAAFVGDRARAPKDYFEQDWTKERWTRGCPVAHVAPGVLTKYGPWLRRSVGKVHFAGTETVRLLAGLHGRRRALRRARRAGGPRGAAPLTPGVQVLRDSLPDPPALDIAVSHALLHARGARRAGAHGPPLPSGADARLRAPRRHAARLRRGGATRRATPASIRSSGSPGVTPPRTTSSR